MARISRTPTYRKHSSGQALVEIRRHAVLSWKARHTGKAEAVIV